MSMLGSKCCCGGEPCDSSSQSGGAGITIRDYRMPVYAGNVTFRYQAYSVPDRFTIYAIHGETEYIVFDTFVQVSGGNTVKIFKPFGITTLRVRVEGPPGTAWNYFISCPEKIDNARYCGPTPWGISGDEKTGPSVAIPPMGGAYLSEAECEAARNAASIQQVEIEEPRVIDVATPSFPISGPSSGGYFPVSVSYGPGKYPCSATTHTNTRQPPHYSLQISGNYISNDPDIYFYYISNILPTQKGRIIYNSISGLSQNPLDTPTRKVAIWGFNDLISPTMVIPLEELTIDRNNAGANWCSTIEKPAGIKYLVVAVAENNPQSARASFSLNFSGLVTSDDNLFQIQSADNVYQSRTVNLGDSSGIVDFYASVYMSNDIFVGCVDAGQPNLLPDPLKDLPRAKFRISDKNNILLEFTIDARTDLDNIPTAGKLDNKNTFVDRLETLFKEAESQEVTVETWYSRNTVFRWTIGCPKPSCFSLCNLTGLPEAIIVEMEADDYFFEYRNLGADVYRNKDYNSSGSGGGNIPLAAGLTFGPATGTGQEWMSLPIGTPQSLIKTPGTWEFIRRYSYNAIWGVPGGVYNGKFELRRRDNGDYGFVFEDTETCPDNTDRSTEIVLKTGLSSTGCGLWMSNFKAFWKWKLGHNYTRQYNCEIIWDWGDYAFSGYTCLSHSFNVGCDTLQTGVIGSRNVLYYLASGTNSSLRSAYDYWPAKSDWSLFTNTFRTYPCYDVDSERCGYYTTDKTTFGGVGYGDWHTIFRGCFSDDEYIPRFQFPYTNPSLEKIDALKTFSSEWGTPYVTVKSVRAV